MTTTTAIPATPVELPIIAEAERAHKAAAAAVADARARLAGAQARIGEATSVATDTRAAAMAPALHLRDMLHLAAMRVIDEGDPQLATARAGAEATHRMLHQALTALRLAERDREQCTTDLARLQEQAQQARRKAWALAHDPALAAELAEAIEAQAEASRFNENERWARAARLRRAQAMLEQAMAEAPAAAE